MDVVVKTAHGEVRGSLVDGVASFKGISYAAAPYGPNRFRPPVRPEPWDGVRDALEYGPTAPHGPYSVQLADLLPEPVIPGEDCLNLNVWSPDVGRSGLPVMVWIHGGAFVNGSGAVPTYSGDRFARDGVVCVTINYRLGCDGFAHLEGVPSNRGLLDQLAALEWVQENIANFGGDPDNVTIFGESAGAMSATSLLSMPRATGLFGRVVAQSGAGHHTLSIETAQLVTAEIARRLGVDPTIEGLATVAVSQLVATQQQLSADIAVSRDRTVWREIAFDSMPFEPVVDGDVLPMRPIDAIAGGAGKDVDVLVGTNHDEYRLFLVTNGAIDFIDDNIVEVTATAMGLGELGVAAYRDPSLQPGEKLVALLNDWFFRIPALRLAELHQGTSHVYEFAWGSPLYDGRLGACHALEIGFVFDTAGADGTGPICGTSPPRELATTMHRAWIDFAGSGRPGWAPYDADTRTTMTFDVESSTVNDPRPAQRVAWDRVR